MKADDSPCAREQTAGVVDEHALIEIPCDINSLQQQSPALAVRWREATRRAFNEALTAGYLVEEFYRLTRNGRRYGIYLLRRGKKAANYIE